MNALANKGATALERYPNRLHQTDALVFFVLTPFNWSALKMLLSIDNKGFLFISNGVKLQE